MSHFIQNIRSYAWMILYRRNLFKLILTLLSMWITFAMESITYIKILWRNHYWTFYRYMLWIFYVFLATYPKWWEAVIYILKINCLILILLSVAEKFIISKFTLARNLRTIDCSRCTIIILNRSLERSALRKIEYLLRGFNYFNCSAIIGPAVSLNTTPSNGLNSHCEFKISNYYEIPF